jgi:hypothetical protein
VTQSKETYNLWCHLCSYNLCSWISCGSMKENGSSSPWCIKKWPNNWLVLPFVSCKGKLWAYILKCTLSLVPTGAIDTCDVMKQILGCPIEWQEMYIEFTILYNSFLPYKPSVWEEYRIDTSTGNPGITLLISSF